MRILVTGGTGYVGRFVVEHLAATGHDVIAAGRTPPADGFFSQPVAFVRAPLDPAGPPDGIFDGVDALVHAALDHAPGRYRGGEGDDPAGFLRINREGTRALFRGAAEAGVSRIVFLSSRAVYGPKAPGTVLTEETPCAPDTLYGQIKRDGEVALSSLDAHTVALRVTGVYGPAGPGRQDKWAGLIADYLAGRPIMPRAGTEVHGRDVARAVQLALDHSDVPAILNVSDLVVDRHDLLSFVRHSAGSAHPLPARADASALNVMDCTRLKALGWTPGGEALLRETVREMVR